MDRARAAETGAPILRPVGAQGVTSQATPCATSSQTFRYHFVALGVTDDDEAVWSDHSTLLDPGVRFESGAPQARAHALTLAGLVLAPEDAARAGASGAT